MQDELISRQAVLELVADYDLSMGQVVRGIHALPSVNPQEPKTGRWIMHDNHRECSECGVYLLKDMPRNSYCPNCGAKMESEE